MGRRFPPLSWSLCRLVTMATSGYLRGASQSGNTCLVLTDSLQSTKVTVIVDTKQISVHVCVVRPLSIYLFIQTVMTHFSGKYLVKNEQKAVERCSIVTFRDQHVICIWTLVNVCLHLKDYSIQICWLGSARHGRDLHHHDNTATRPEGVSRTDDAWCLK